MNPTDQISLKRDEINVHHDVAAKHLRDFYREQNLISALNEELEQLLLQERSEALRNLQNETRREVAGPSRTADECGPPEPATGIISPRERCNEMNCDQRATHLVTNRNGFSFDNFLSCEAHIAHFKGKARAGWISTVEPWPRLTKAEENALAVGPQKPRW